MATRPEPEPETNPYAPPTAELTEAPASPGSAELARAEALRRAYLGTETAVRLVGTSHDLAAGFGLLALLGAGFYVLSAGGVRAVGLSTLVFLALFVVNLALGRGLRWLAPWAHTLGLAVYSLGLFILVAAGVQVQSSPGPWAALAFFAALAVVPGGLLAFFLTRGVGVVFSPDYRDAVRDTPHIGPKAGCQLVGFLAMLALGTILITMLLLGVG